MLRERGWTVPKATTFGTCDLAGMRDGDTPTLVESALGALRKLRKPTRPTAASTGGRDRRAAGMRRDRGQSRPGTVTQAA